MSEKPKVTMDDALAAGDGVILNVQAARIKELEEQNKDLREVLEKTVVMLAISAADTESKTYKRFQEVIAKAKGEE